MLPSCDNNNSSLTSDMIKKCHTISLVSMLYQEHQYNSSDYDDEVPRTGEGLRRVCRVALSSRNRLLPIRLSVIGANTREVRDVSRLPRRSTISYALFRDVIPNVLTIVIRLSAFRFLSRSSVPHSHESDN